MNRCRRLNKATARVERRKSIRRINNEEDRSSPKEVEKVIRSPVTEKAKGSEKGLSMGGYLAG